MEENAGYYLTLAEVELKAGNYDKALGYMEKGKELDPNYIDWDLYEIYLWQVQEDYVKVAELCGAYYERDDKNVKVLEIWQEASYYLEWDRDVIGIGFAAIDLQTENLDVYFRIADIYEKYGRYRDAISVLEPVAEHVPEFLERLQDLYYSLVHEEGHYSMADAKKSLEYADQYRQHFGLDWRVEYRDLETRLQMADFEGAIKVADEAIAKLQTMDNLREEDMPDPEIIYKWEKGRAMMLNRKDPFAMPFDRQRLDEAFAHMEKSYKEAVEKEDTDMRMCILENMNFYWFYTEKYDEGIEFVKQVIEDYAGTDVDMSEMNEMISRFYTLKKDYATAREYRLKAVGSFDLGSFTDAISGKTVTAENLADFPQININGEVDRIEEVLNALTLVPELFTEEERIDAINDLLCFIEKIIELNRDEVDAMIPIVGHAIGFGPAIIDDYERLYKIINSKYMKKMFSNAKQKYREKYNKNLMRICYFLGNENESKVYAKNYLADLNEKPICRDKEVTFEEAVKEPRFSNRIDIAALGTAYLYMGRVEDAKNMLVLMMMNPVCWFCKKCGCLEYYLLKAEIDIVEGNLDEARHFLDEVEKTEWNGHEEIAASLKKYLEKQ